MGVMIIDSEGNTLHEDNEREPKAGREDPSEQGRGNPSEQGTPQLEVVVSNDRIAKLQDEERAIIARTLGHPLY